MRHVATLLVAAGFACAQSGQTPPRPGWPCVAGRPVDPAFLDASESTGGQLFMFQRSEAAQSAAVLTASSHHKATILRIVGNLNGSRDFSFPVDSTVSSLLVMASIQCRNAVRLSRPNGAELTAAESASNIDLQAGRIVRIDRPEPGAWSVRLAGTGMFLLSALATSDIALNGVSFSGSRSPVYGISQPMEMRLSGVASNLRFQLIDAAGNPLSDPEAPGTAPDGAFTAVVTPNTERLRILVAGTDASALPFQRVYPILLRAAPAK